MTVPFNSAVINGGAWSVVWAEGCLEADARSLANAERTAWTRLDPALGGAVGKAIAVRQTRPHGSAEARGEIADLVALRITPGEPLSPTGEAEASGVAYRARQVDGLPVEASAVLSSPEPQRLVRMAPEYRAGGLINGEPMGGAVSWSAGLVVTAEALADSRIINARLIDVRGVAEPVAEASSPEIPITRTMAPHRMRTATLAFARSQDVMTIRVRQVRAGGPAIVRAQGRATPNAILGFGWSYCDAESALSAAHVQVARAVYPGNAEAEAESSTQSHLVRIIEFLFQAHAEFIASPDILRDDTRYAYVDGGMLAEAFASEPIARRFPLFEPVPCEGIATASAVPRFEPRSRAIHRAGARVVLNDNRLTLLHRVSARLSFVAEALSPVMPTVLRDGRGSAVAKASAGIDAIRWIAREASGQMLASAEAQGDNFATLYMAGQARSEPALSAAGAVRSAFMSAAAAEGAGSVAMQAVIYAIVSAELSQMAAGAESRALALRVKTTAPLPMTSSASILPRSFKINADKPAPARRTFRVPSVDRRLALPASSREYRIT